MENDQFAVIQSVKGRSKFQEREVLFPQVGKDCQGCGCYPFAVVVAVGPGVAAVQQELISVGVEAVSACLASRDCRNLSSARTTPGWFLIRCCVSSWDPQALEQIYADCSHNMLYFMTQPVDFLL